MLDVKSGQIYVCTNQIDHGGRKERSMKWY